MRRYSCASVLLSMLATACLGAGGDAPVGDGLEEVGHEGASGELLAAFPRGEGFVSFYEVEPGFVMVKQQGPMGEYQPVSFEDPAMTLTEKYTRLAGEPPSGATADRLAAAQATLERLTAQSDEGSTEVREASHGIEQGVIPKSPSDAEWFENKYCCGREFCRTNMKWVRHSADATSWAVASFNQQHRGSSRLTVWAKRDSLIWPLFDDRIEPRTVLTISWTSSKTYRYNARTDGSGSAPRVSQSVDYDGIVCQVIVN